MGRQHYGIFALATFNVLTEACWHALRHALRPSRDVHRLIVEAVPWLLLQGGQVHSS